MNYSFIIKHGIISEKQKCLYEGLIISISSDEKIKIHLENISYKSHFLISDQKF